MHPKNPGKTKIRKPEKNLILKVPRTRRNSLLLAMSYFMAILFFASKVTTGLSITPLTNKDWANYFYWTFVINLSLRSCWYSKRLRNEALLFKLRGSCSLCSNSITGFFGTRRRRRTSKDTPKKTTKLKQRLKAHSSKPDNADTSLLETFKKWGTRFTLSSYQNESLQKILNSGLLILNLMECWNVCM